MKELKDYLKERIEICEGAKDYFIKKMTEAYNEDGYYRGMYFETLARIRELEEVLKKIEEVEVNEENK